jgi:hypothetical protein
MRSSMLHAPRAFAAAAFVSLSISHAAEPSAKMPLRITVEVTAPLIKSNTAGIPLSWDILDGAPDLQLWYSKGLGWAYSPVCWDTYSCKWDSVEVDVDIETSQFRLNVTDEDDTSDDIVVSANCMVVDGSKLLCTPSGPGTLAVGMVPGQAATKTPVASEAGRPDASTVAAEYQKQMDSTIPDSSTQFKFEGNHISGSLRRSDYEGLGLSQVEVLYGGEHEGHTVRVYSRGGATTLMTSLTTIWVGTTDAASETMYLIEGKTCVQEQTRRAETQDGGEDAVLAALKAARFKTGACSPDWKTAFTRAERLRVARTPQEVIKVLEGP